MFPLLSRISKTCILILNKILHFCAVDFHVEYQEVHVSSCEIITKVLLNNVTTWQAIELAFKTGHKKQLNAQVRRSNFSIFCCRVRCQEYMGST